MRPWEAIFVGMTGSLVVLTASDVLEKIHIDDPVGAVAVHGIGGIWVRWTTQNPSEGSQRVFWFPAVTG